MSDDQQQSLVRRAVEAALRLEPDELKRYADAKRSAHPDLSPRELADKLARMYASKAGIEGFVTGIPGNPFIALPAAAADAAYVLQCHARLTATIGYLSNPSYFDDPGWKNDVYAMVLGRTLVSRTLRDAGVLFGKQATRLLIRRQLCESVLQALKRGLLRWFARKITQRAILATSVPLVGGIVGGTWNMAECRMIGKRAITYHFDTPQPT